MQFLIAFDQTLNTLIWLPDDGFGMADETLSARAYRLREQHPWLMRSFQDAGVHKHGQWFVKDGGIWKK